MKNHVQLITYVDRLGGGGLRELAALLDGPLAGLFGGVHLLPFFHPIDGARYLATKGHHPRLCALVGLAQASVTA